jgi:hypothetical protein
MERVAILELQRSGPPVPSLFQVSFMSRRVILLIYYRDLEAAISGTTISSKN